MRQLHGINVIIPTHGTVYLNDIMQLTVSKFARYTMNLRIYFSSLMLNMIYKKLKVTDNNNNNDKKIFVIATHTCLEHMQTRKNKKVDYHMQIDLLFVCKYTFLFSKNPINLLSNIYMIYLSELILDAGNTATTIR